MAGLIGEGTDQAEMLMRRLRRLAIRADRVDAGDRAKIIALIDDVETVRQCAPTPTSMISSTASDCL